MNGAVMKVKVCGITNRSDALMCQSAGADALGFIFYKGSKRFVDPEKAAEIIHILSPFVLKVGVFVNESPEFVNGTAEEIGLNAVQLHGDESPETASQIKFPVIKSFRIKEGFNFSMLKKYGRASFLLDTHSASEYGGTGNSFSWGVIPEEIRNEIILAGGVSAANISQIIETINPAAVDLSSSLEEKPGIKDEEKVKTFFKIINNYRSLRW